MTEAAPTPARPVLPLRLLARLATVRESGVATAGAVLVGFWVLVALLAPLVAPHDPNATIAPFQEPFSATEAGTFLLGTDHLGRDILSRILYGARRVLFYAVLATAAAYAVGIVMGLLAGYRRGWVDDALSLVSNVILSFPVMVLYVVLIANVEQRGGATIVLAVTFASAPGIMRIVRGLVLDIRTRDYVAAAQTRGEPAWWIMLVEILPNARGPLIVDACLRLGYVTITIGVLGFLGLGLPPPDPDWGGMVNETRTMALVFPWMSVFPCIAISSLVLGLNLLADGIREISLKD